jgi:hypothetical protein
LRAEFRRARLRPLHGFLIRGALGGGRTLPGFPIGSPALSLGLRGFEALRTTHHDGEAYMKIRILADAMAGVLLLAAASTAGAGDVAVSLTGDEEVPAVTTQAKGSGKITIADDMSVSGSIRTTGVVGLMAHIHEGAAGKNGPPIIPLEKKGDDEWAVPAGAKLTDAQYASFKAGNLYVNVHSADHRGGEIRNQLKP